MNPNRRAISRIASALTVGFSDTRSGRLFLRRAIGLLFRIGLRLRSRPFPYEEVGTVVVIAPHPDDESFGCGGTLAIMARRQAVLNLVFLTDGSASHPGHPTVSPSEIAQRRRDEARRAAGVLGLPWERVEFLDVRDGTLSHLDAESIQGLEARIGALLARARPTSIFLTCRRDGRAEHEAAFTRVTHAIEVSGLRARILEYPVWSWWNPALLLGPMRKCRRVWRADCRSTLDSKARALALYASQTLPIAPEVSPALPQGFASMFLHGGEYFFEW